MAIDDFQGLVIKSIESYARVETRVGSLEQSIGLMRTENEKILAKISESLERLASIQEKLSRNADDHKVIHERIDDSKLSVSAVEAAIAHLQKNCNSTNHTAFVQKLEALEKEFARRSDVTDKKIEHIYGALKPFTYKIIGIPILKEFPIWVLLVCMILLGFGVDVYSNSWITSILGWRK